MLGCGINGQVLVCQYGPGGNIQGSFPYQVLPPTIPESQCSGRLTPAPTPGPTPRPTPAPTPAPRPTPRPLVPINPTPTPSPQQQCSANSQDCRSNRCCSDPRYTCYQKDAWWAGCLQSCTPGIHSDEATQYQTPWSCAVLGKAPLPTPAPMPSPPQQQCTAQYQDCRSSQCCSDPGLTCFRKDTNYATCQFSCTPGIHSDEPPQFQTPWSCQVLGAAPSPMPSPPQKQCTAQYQDCRISQCCSDPGYTCYLKDNNYGTCLQTCTPGIHVDEPSQFRTPWSCQALGESPPQKLPQQQQCTPHHQDCRSTRCCTDVGYKCYQKDPWHAQCMQSCTPGIHMDEPPVYQTPWSCKVL